MKPIRAIHPYGPAVGKWTREPTVAATIAKELKRLKEQSQPANVTELKTRRKP